MNTKYWPHHYYPTCPCDSCQDAQNIRELEMEPDRRDSTDLEDAFLMNLPHDA